MAIIECNYIFSGMVIDGNHIGRRMSVPTVNIPIKAEAVDVLPEYGVYAAQIELPNGKLYKGIANLGVKPTIEMFDEEGNYSKNKVGLEVNLFDYDGVLYGENLVVRLYAFVRKEMKFDDISLLKSQIEHDIKEVIAYNNSL